MPHYLPSILHAHIPHPILYPRVCMDSGFGKGLIYLHYCMLIYLVTPQCGFRIWIQDLEKGYNASLFIFYTGCQFTSSHTFTTQCGFRIWKRVLKSCLLTMPHYLPHADIPHPIPYPTVWNQNLEKSLDIIIYLLLHADIPHPIPLLHSVESGFGKGS